MFSKEPPTDNPLVGRPDVVCTPHLGASTREAQEGVAVEIAEAVVAALKVCLALGVIPSKCHIMLGPFRILFEILLP